MKILKHVLPIFALAMMALGLSAQTARAQAVYTCDGGSNPVPAVVTSGNVEVEQTGNCTIANGVNVQSGSLRIDITSGTVNSGPLQSRLDTGVTASGAVTTTTITTTYGAIGISAGGNVTTQALQTTATAGTPVVPGAIAINPSTTGSIVTVNGTIQAGSYVDLTGGTVNITGAISAAQNDIYLQATGNIYAGGGLTSYGGQITAHANTAASSTTNTTAFAVGNGGTNGIKGAAIADGTGIGGGVYITNGGTGGITVAKGADISAVANAATPGYVILDACNENDTDLTCSAPITIGSGTISTDGTSAYPAGGQLYIARSITVNGTTLSAKDTAPASGHLEHYVILSAQKMTLSGTGLTVTSTGATNTALNLAAQFNDQGAISATDQFGGAGSLIRVSSTAAPANPVTVFGPGKLTINGSGANSMVNIQGNPLTFDSSLGVVSITNNSATSTVNIHTGSTGALSFNEIAAFTVNANGTTAGSDAGSITISASQIISPVVPPILLTANGTKTHNGGPVSLQVTQTASNISLGTKSGQFALSATGGTSSGNGSSNITVSSAGGNIVISTPNAVLANAPTSGNGGTIQLNGIVSTPATLATAGVIATGAGTGKGGSVKLSSASGNPFNVNATISVKAGATAATQADGTIKTGTVHAISF